MASNVAAFITTEVYLMPTIEKLSIALPSEMAALVRRAVDAGEYSSNSEVIRDALRD
jgi:antitoxin ParD1/3/4